MTETFVKERKHAVTGKVQQVGIDDAAAVLTPLRQRLARHVRVDPLRPRPQGALHARDQRREGLARAGTCTTSTACNGSTTRVEGPLRGWPSIHVTDGDHPYMGNWWVPGLQIGYEHSFVHPVADFLEGLSTGKPAAPTFREALGDGASATRSSPRVSPAAG